MSKIKYQTFKDAWEALYPDDPEKQEAMRLRSKLITQIQTIIETRQLKSKQLQNIWEVPHSRVSELMNGKIAKFSAEKLHFFLRRLDYIEQEYVEKRRGA